MLESFFWVVKLLHGVAAGVLLPRIVPVFYIEICKAFIRFRIGALIGIGCYRASLGFRECSVLLFLFVFICLPFASKNWSTVCGYTIVPPYVIWGPRFSLQQGVSTFQPSPPTWVLQDS